MLNSYIEATTTTKKPINFTINSTHEANHQTQPLFTHIASPSAEHQIPQSYHPRTQKPSLVDDYVESQIHPQPNFQSTLFFFCF